MATRRLRDFFKVLTLTKDRFVKNDKPTQSQFEDLRKSTAFMLNSEDRAEESTQGLVKLASDTNTINYDSERDSDGFNKVMQPHQSTKVEHEGGDNQITVTQVSEITGRTKPDGSAGSGKLFKVENTFTVVPNGTPVPWLNINQTAPGEEVDLEYDDSAFEASLSSSTVITNIVNTQVQGHASEMKMYIGVRPGDASSQFAANGAGRNNGILGANGSWVGWEVCDGAVSVFDASTKPDMRQNVPVGLDTTDASYDDIAKTLGTKDVTLTGAQSGLVAHLHDIDSTGNAVVNGGDHQHGVQGTLNNQGVYQGFNQPDHYPVPDGPPGTQGESSEEPYKGLPNAAGGEPDNIILTYEEGDSIAYHPTDINSRPVIVNPGHTHVVSGNTESVSAANASSSHENRPPSFVVVFAFFTGADGQNI